MFTLYAIGYRSAQFVRRVFCITRVTAVNSFTCMLNSGWRAFGKNCILFHRIGQTCIWLITYRLVIDHIYIYNHSGFGIELVNIEHREWNSSLPRVQLKQKQILNEYACTCQLNQPGNYEDAKCHVLRNQV